MSDWGSDNALPEPTRQEPVKDQTWMDAEVANKTQDAIKKYRAEAPNREADERRTKMEEGSKRTKAATGKIAKSYYDAADSVDAETAKFKSANRAYRRTIDEQMEETKKLTKWHEGIVTDYNQLAKRYRDQIDEAEKWSDTQRRQAQSDYAGNAALMSKAASVGMGAGGPMTGTQQQLMMSAAQQSATTAYALAQDRISAMETQRKELGMQLVQSAMNDERQNRSMGFGMQQSQIRDNVTMAQNKMLSSESDYQKAIDGIMTRVEAETYEPEAEIAAVGNEYSQMLSSHGMSMSERTGQANIDAANRGQGGYTPNRIGAAFSRGLSGAAAGASMSGGNPYVAAAAGVIGFGSAFFD